VTGDRTTNLGRNELTSTTFTANNPDLRTTLQSMPKLDLHRHLEGSLRLETLTSIALEHGVDLPSYDLEKLRPYVQITEDYQPDFCRFLDKFKLLRRFYKTEQAIERIAYEAVADAASDNLKYLELRFNPVALASEKGFRYSDVMDWVWEAASHAQADHDIVVRLIVSLTRQEPDSAQEVAEAAMQHRDRGVVALDLSGDEVNYPLQPFIPLFQRARDAGLGVIVHAGEAGGPENVREAIEMLNPDRIGHGVRCIQNPDVARLVRDRGIALEICPTSNYQTGVMRLMKNHPLPDLYHLGIKVTINTDDPSISDTTLSDEYLLVIAGMGMLMTDLKTMIMTAVSVTFLPPNDKAALEARFRAELDRS
jgi:adenosine deaminase